MMEKLRDATYWKDLQKAKGTISLHPSIVQKYLDEDLNSVKMEIKKFQDVLQQINVRQFIAPTKEGDDMSDTLLERVTRTETLVEQMSIKLDKMDTKLDGLATKDFVEKEVNKSEASTIKWIVGSGVAMIGILSAIVFGIIKSVQP